MVAPEQDSRWVSQQPSGGLLKSLAYVPKWKFVKMLVPLTIAFLIAFLLVYRADFARERERLLSRERSVIQSGVRRAEQGLEIAAGDLRFVSDLVTELADDRDPDRLFVLERSLLALMQRRPGYLQIRFIGAAGQEILRVDDRSAGAAIPSSRELPDESKRSYFTRTMGLELGEMLVTSMGLSLGPGALEGEYEPAVRLTTPIDLASGLRRGIVVLNARAANFLSAYEQSGSDTGIQRMIIGADGRWGQYRSETEGGLSLGRNFERTFPNVLPQLEASQQEWIDRREALFYLETVTPPADSSAGGDAGEIPIWMLVSSVPRQLLDDLAFQVATPLLIIATPVFYALLAIGCLLAAALHRRDESLRGLEASRDAMLSAALDGIVVMDDLGTTLDFNPSAQRIFGYTREEVRGKLVADLIIPPAHREAHRGGLKRYLTSGEGRIIGKHIDELTAIRKSGEEFPVELTVCRPVVIGRRRIFYGFLRDLSEPVHGKAEAQTGPDASSS